MFSESFWRAWRWLAWIMPVLLIVAKVFTGGGWETLMLIFGSPLVVLVVGFFGFLPRLILKQRGFTSAPPAAIGLLTGYWVSMACYLFSLGSIGDSSADPSIVRLLLPFMSARYERLFNWCAAITMMVAAVALIIVASTLRKKREGRSDSASGGALVLAVLVTPALILGVAGATEYAAMHGAQDAAGNQQIDVANLTEAEIRQLHESRWDALQEQLVPLRESVAESGWGPYASMVVDSLGSPHSAEPPQYVIQTEWAVGMDTADGPSALNRLRDALAENGWSLKPSDDSDQLHATRADGETLAVYAWPSADDPTQLTIWLDARSAAYWSEGVEVEWQSLNQDGDESADYRYDEWPELQPED